MKKLIWAAIAAGLIAAGIVAGCGTSGAARVTPTGAEATWNDCGRTNQ